MLLHWNGNKHMEVLEPLNALSMDNSKPFDLPLKKTTKSKSQLNIHSFHGSLNMPTGYSTDTMNTQMATLPTIDAGNATTTPPSATSLKLYFIDCQDEIDTKLLLLGTKDFGLDVTLKATST